MSNKKQSLNLYLAPTKFKGLYKTVKRFPVKDKKIVVKEAK